MTKADTAILELYEPINTLKFVAPDVWIVDGPLVWMNYLGLTLPFPTRMTVVRLANGGLFLHSPTALTPSLQAALDELGTVAHLVSPNCLHYSHIAAWSEAYPKAETWASPGVKQRAHSQHIAVSFARTLGESAAEAWQNDLDQLILHGSRVLEEVVFFHKSTKTLILTDLIENFELAKIKAPYRWLVALSGAADPDGKAPLDMRWTFAGRKKLAREGVQRMLAWKPERVLLSHGRWYRENGEEEVRRAFRWVL